MEHNISFSIIDFIFKGGFFMWPLLAVSFLVVIISIERYLAYRFRFGIDGKRLFNQVKKYLAAGDNKRALEAARQYSTTPLGNVLASGLENVDQPIDELDVAMEAEALRHLPSVTDRLGYLSILANISTLLGLLGTVSGLIASFSAVGVEAGAAKGMLLASGIAVAMNTTAFGLCIAIPTLLIHQFLSTRANRIVDEVQHYATELKRIIQRSRSGGRIDTNDTDEEVSHAGAKKKAAATVS